MIDRRLFLAGALAGITQAAPAAAAGRLRSLPSFDGATAWLNSPPLTAAALRGKVVLVEFWTYTCINWRREYGYVRAWAAKYRDPGLVVIGVHSPEFSFEGDLAHVKQAVTDIGVDHPVAVDSRQAVWRAFDNTYWPALYFVDAQGRIRHTHDGEGDYGESERVLQQLLSEAGAPRVPRDLVGATGTGAEAPPDLQNLRSPESYVGYAQASHLVSAGVTPDKRQRYAAPTRLARNEWGFAGDWTQRAEVAESNAADAGIVYRFHARDVHLVMGSASGNTPVRFRVTLDGMPPGEAHGVDVDPAGNGVATMPRLYQLIRQPGPIDDRRFEIEFLDPGAAAYCFTFG